MKQKPVTTTDSELSALVIVHRALAPLCWDQQWRVLNYVIVRLWGRAWSLAKPASDKTPQP